MFVPGADAVGAAAFLVDLFSYQAEYRHSATQRLVQAIPTVRHITYARNWVSQSITSKREANMTTHLKRLAEKHSGTTTFLPDWVARLGFAQKETDERLRTLAASQENQYFLEVPIQTELYKWDVGLLLGDERTLCTIAQVPMKELQIYLQNRNPHQLIKELEKLPKPERFQFILPSLQRATTYWFSGRTVEGALFEAYQFCAKVPAFYSYAVEKALIETMLRNEA